MKRDINLSNFHMEATNWILQAHQLILDHQSCKLPTMIVLDLDFTVSLLPYMGLTLLLDMVNLFC